MGRLVGGLVCFVVMGMTYVVLQLLRECEEAAGDLSLGLGHCDVGGGVGSDVESDGGSDVGVDGGREGRTDVEGDVEGDVEIEARTGVK